MRLATTQKLYWNPNKALRANYLLRHQAPELVGHLPRLRQNSLRAALHLAAVKAPRLPNPLSPKSPLAAKPMGASVAFPQPVIPREGLPFTPPASSGMPQAGHLVRQGSLLGN